MTALFYLWRRLCRRVVLANLRSRLAQLDDCIDGLEMQVWQEQAELHQMRCERTRINALLAGATQAAAAAAAPRTGWGQP